MAASWAEEEVGTYGSVEESNLLLAERQKSGCLPLENDNSHHSSSWRTQQLWVRLLLFFGSVASIALAISSKRNHSRTATYSFKEPEYEYIVVGGGPSGILTATKLAQHLADQKEDGKVLLLESGTDTQSSVYESVKTLQQQGPRTASLWEDDEESLNKFDIPLMWSGVASPSAKHHWPIEHALLARALGGCGLHNAMIYVRSLPNDFARWNLSDWTWETLLPHYQSLETFMDSLWTAPALTSSSTSKLPSDQPSWRGRNGPIVTVPAGPYIDSVGRLFVESAVASGLRLAKDGFNSPEPDKRVGVGYYEFNIRNGVRDSVAQAMLGTPENVPRNLVIQTGATVSKVILETTHGSSAVRAVGVEYSTNNSRRMRSKAMLKRERLGETAREVILAAGAIMTPQILANSGIGKGGTVVDLPGVGQNLQDHPVVALAFHLDPRLDEDSPSMITLACEFDEYFLSRRNIQSETSSSMNNPNLKQWAAGLGILGTAGFSAGAFLTSPWAENDSPDIQLTVFPRIVEPHVMRRASASTNRSDAYVIKPKAMLVTVALLQPEARYQVRTASPHGDAVHSTIVKPHETDSSQWDDFDFQLPSLDLHENKTHYLSSMDSQRLSWGIEQVRRILSTAPLKNMTRDEAFPGSDVVGHKLDKFIQENHLPNSHWVGSTKMGRSDDPLAVVDEQLRVRGVANLRIVDSGVIPVIPNGNTHSTVCVVASRAVEMILAQRDNPILSFNDDESY